MPFFGGAGDYKIVGTNIDGGNDVLAVNVGDYNIGLGNSALLSNTTGSGNIALGFESLLSNTTGTDNIAVGRDSASNVTVGTKNIAVGTSAVNSVTSGSRNIGIGYGATELVSSGSDNVGIGENAAAGISTGSRNTFVGSRAVAVADISNTIAVGYGLSAALSNQILIGDASHTSIVIGGKDFSAGLTVPGGSTGQMQYNNAGAFGGANVYYSSDVLAMRNGVTGQTFLLYNTYTDPSNYERGFMRWSGNVLQIGTQAAGTGTLREMKLMLDGYSPGYLTISGDPVLSGASSASLISTAGAAKFGRSGYLFYAGLDGVTPALGVESGNSFKISGATRGNDAAPGDITVVAGTAWSSAAANIVGANLLFLGGNGSSASAGNAHGGNVYLRGGQGYGTGHHGYLYFGDSNTAGISFFGVTPVAQYSTTGTVNGFTDGGAITVHSSSTFTGDTGSTAYTIGDIVRLLKLAGLAAA